MAELNSPMIQVGKRAKNAAQQLRGLSHDKRVQVLNAVAEALEKHAEDIVAANTLDVETHKDNLAAPLLSRLRLPMPKLRDAIMGVRDVAKLPDPIGALSLHRKLDEGLVLKRFACPLGVLGIIFESRPDVLVQISCLAIKSGNAVIMKGGKESSNSCNKLGQIIRDTLSENDIDPNVVQVVTSREEVQGLLSLDRYIDLIIPRGSNALVRYVQQNTRIPVLGHADGICHVYIDQSAEEMVEDVVKILVDSKAQYPSACNSVETILVHEQVARKVLPAALKGLADAKVECRLCPKTLELYRAGVDEQKVQGVDEASLKEATEDDWSTEYSDLIVSIKTVADMDAAMEHIQTYGSMHTDCILTRDEAAANRFMQQVDAAGVFWNASTRFADGFRYGFGAEVGVSTHRLPPRGPVGLEGLVTYKYTLSGDAQNPGACIAATYMGDNPKQYLHEDLPLDNKQ